MRSTSSAPENAAPSTFGTSRLRFPVGIAAGNPRTAHMEFRKNWVSRGLSLVMLHCEGYGSLDLGEISQVHSRKRIAFNFCQFVYVMHTITNVIPNLFTTTSHKCRTWKGALSTNSPQWRVPLTRILV